MCTIQKKNKSESKMRIHFHLQIYKQVKSTKNTENSTNVKFKVEFLF